MQTAFARQKARERFSGHRGDGIQFQRLLTGPPGREDTFELSVIHVADGYSTPRHHHNFDQLRYCLRGRFNYARGKDINAGDVLYVPEGTWYGPHRNSGEAELLIIQYGGNNGSGFLTYEELSRGFVELETRGRFENGIFRPHPPPAAAGDQGPSRNQDGYEAIWEQVKGTPVDYPEPRYDEPILIHPPAFGWLPVRGAPGVEEKNLGVFGERRNQVRLIRLTAGHAVKIGTGGCFDLLFVVDGEVRADGQALTERDALSLAPDDDAVELVAARDTVIFTTALPDFSSVTS